MSDVTTSRVDETRKLSRRAPGHIAALDGVRGLAISAVLLFHMNLHVHAYRFHSAPPKQAAARALLAVTDRGWIGVDLFFVLSGFLITRILVDARTSTNYYRVFYARRALRIFPLYFSVLVLGLVVVPSLAHITSAGYTSAVQHQRYLWTYCSNIGSSFGVEFGPFSHFWSLAVEEHFYLLWPFLVRISPPKRLAVICIVCIFGALAVRLALILAGLPVAAGWLTPSRVDAFGFGGLAAVVADGVTNTKWRRLFGRAIFAISLGLAVIVRCAGTVRGQPAGVLALALPYSVFAAASATLIWFAATNTPQSFTSRALSARPLRALGKYSYGMYVLHLPMLPVLYVILQRSLGLVRCKVTSELGMLIAFDAFALVCCTAVAAASWHLFESHFLKVKPKFLYVDTSAGSLDSRQRPVVD